MKKIKKLVDQINEELEGAKDYAESYVEYKANGEASLANRFKEMANDELKHANYIHELAVDEIATLGRVYTPPAEMQEEWDKTHVKYVECAAWIKQMLTL